MPSAFRLSQTLAVNCKMHIREFQLGDEAGLYTVFLSAIHELASKDYSPEQIEAWAPASFNPELWAKRMQGIRPFVVESHGKRVAYADVQPTGYIDHCLWPVRSHRHRHHAHEPNPRDRIGSRHQGAHVRCQSHRSAFLRTVRLCCR